MSTGLLKQTSLEYISLQAMYIHVAYRYMYIYNYYISEAARLYNNITLNINWIISIDLIVVLN